MGRKFSTQSSSTHTHNARGQRVCDGELVASLLTKCDCSLFMLWRGFGKFIHSACGSCISFPSAQKNIHICAIFVCNKFDIRPITCTWFAVRIDEINHKSLDENGSEWASAIDNLLHFSLDSSLVERGCFGFVVDNQSNVVL